MHFAVKKFLHNKLLKGRIQPDSLRGVANLLYSINQLNFLQTKGTCQSSGAQSGIKL